MPEVAYSSADKTNSSGDENSSTNNNSSSYDVSRDRSRGGSEDRGCISSSLFTPTMKEAVAELVGTCILMVGELVPCPLTRKLALKGLVCGWVIRLWV